MSSENKSDGTPVYDSSMDSQPSRSRLHLWLARRLLQACNNPPIQIVLWDGTETSGTAAPTFRLKFHKRRAFYQLLIYPDLYFGEAYMRGDLEVEGGLIECLEAIYTGRNGLAQSLKWRLIHALISPARRNHLKGSRRNIQHHYDIGNEFYEKWLDRAAMQYTCAYYRNPSATLEEAQLAKLEHVCRKLQLKPGDTVVEAGCGWGGLARYMAKNYHVSVRAYNISHEQIVYARAKAKEQGLEGLVEYVEDDYRNIEGQYDVFVSVGMLEHVGVAHFPGLNQVIQRALKPEGLGLIHTIGRNVPGKMNAWIERHIFPGSEPPSMKQMQDIFTNGLVMLDVENLRLHYAATVRHWLERFEEYREKFAAQFDEKFMRTWYLYLCGSTAAFTSDQLQLYQIVFAREANNKIPMTREHIYQNLPAAAPRSAQESKA